MKISLPTARGSTTALALIACAWLAQPLQAQSQLDVSEARAFLGTWVISMQTDFGPFNMDMAIEDRAGKVGASIGSPEMGGQQNVTDISRAGESLVLAFEANAQGQFFDVTVSLEPDGETLAVWFEVGGGQFAASGVARRAAS